jgi:hypothetical protein
LVWVIRTPCILEASFGLLGAFAVSGETQWLLEPRRSLGQTHSCRGTALGKSVKLFLLQYLIFCACCVDYLDFDETMRRAKEHAVHPKYHVSIQSYSLIELEISSGRPTFKNALTFSQASGSAMGSMGSFRHPSSRLESDARREEREREGRRETENLRNVRSPCYCCFERMFHICIVQLSQQFDRERRDREAAPHLSRIVSGSSNANGRDSKSREGGKDSTRDSRRGRGDDAHDWRRARDDDRQRSRSRPRGKGNYH